MIVTFIQMAARSAGSSFAGHTLQSVKAIPSLDGVRAVSILIVALAHCGFGNIVPGGLGVTIFFVLSGYLITTLLRAEAAKTGRVAVVDFYIRRALRLTPPLLVTLALAYGLTALGIMGGRITWHGALAQIFYVFNYYTIFFDVKSATVPGGTGVLWSLAVEEHYYLLFAPFIGYMVYRGVGASRLLGLFAAICAAVLAWRLYLAAAPGFFPERTSLATDTRLDSILFGAILAVAANPLTQPPGQKHMKATELAVLAGCCATLLVTLAVRNEYFRETLRYAIQPMAIAPLLFLSIRYSKSVVFGFLNSSIMTLLGRYSYSIYLVHGMVIDACYTNLPRVAEKPFILFAAVMAVSTLYAALIDTFMEPYFRSLRQKFHADAPAAVGPSLAAAQPVPR